MKVRIDVGDLEQGMYVAELDRPWLDSPFLFQGFILESQEDITKVKQVCQFVYIDGSQSTPTAQNALQQLQNKGASGTPTRMGTVHSQQQAGGGAGNFHNVLKQAVGVHQRGRLLTLDLLKSAQLQRRINISAARELVKDTADNLMRDHNVMLWLTYLKQRDEYTLTHCMNVSILAMNFARHLQLDRTQIELVGLGALLHDLGKMRIPDAILNKPGRLTAEEFAIMQTHPHEGFNLLANEEALPGEVLDVVLHHHERVSGNGYPDKLPAAEIPQLTKIASIVDVYDAITSDRCYHDGVSPYHALQNIYKWANENFDKHLVEEFISCMGLYPVGSAVALNHGQIGIVVATTPKTRLRPIVLITHNQQGEPVAVRSIINLATQEWKKDKRLEIQRVIEPKEFGLDVRKIIEQESLATR